MVMAMVKYENECVFYTAHGLNCIGYNCPNRQVKHFYCDKCGEDVRRLYDFGGKELCGDCVLKELEVVE